jgi:Tfp pilus assembly protein PilF
MKKEESNRIEMLKEYLKDDPGDSFSNYALALEYMKINQAEQAVEILEKILKRDKQYLAAYYQLGKGYEKMKRIEDAKTVYLKGVEIANQQKNQRTKNELQSAFDSMIEDD